MVCLKKLFAFGVMLSLSVTIGVAGASAEKVLKIGGMAPLTGPSAKTGQEIKQSAEMAFEEAGNMIGDYKVELVWIDSQSDPAKATNAYAEAVERKGIQVGLLNWHSSVAIAVMDLAAKYKIPHLFGIGGSSVINEKYRSDMDKYNGYWLKSWPVPQKTMTGYVEFLEDAIASGKFKPHSKKVVIFAEDTDWGRDIFAGAKKMFGDAGWEIVAEDFLAQNQTEFYPLLTKWKKLEPALVFGSYGMPVGITSLIKQSREVGLKVPMICDGLGWAGEWYSLAGSASDYTLDMIQKLATDKAKAWAANYEKKYGDKPSPSSGGLAYDSAKLFIKVAKRALEKTGKLDSESLRQVVLDELLTGKITYSEDEGAITVSRFSYNEQSLPDPAVGVDDWYLPIIQYKSGKGRIVYPKAWAEAEFHVIQ
ncbi:ABC transporter substrate-binding protein [Desulforhopalus singaporensis]|uniref:Branched-chain amino acid transport system substrate-binding protein n=1 Tax=Desulforhopalus singaporensis TaxID=91360 RepID=A0A1H0KEL9_9BACT|nr:ABC transporter substrate-binding protein [Desulforhopalus singaporensis]SDO54377.1 branched-chain amino acid transport system substrate-binding protein [Desulforhopalus singaporensis]